MVKKLLPWLVLASLAGCVTAPPAVDPFAGMHAYNPVYRDLTLAIVVSQNTENTLTYARSGAVAHSRGTFGPKIQTYIGQIAAEFLPKTFKSAVKVDRIEDAASVHADVVAVLDVQAEGGIRAGKTTTISVSLICMTPDGRRLDVIKGTGAQTIAFPDFPSAFDAAVTGAIGQTQRSLEDSLFNSAPLLELAKARAGTAGAPVAAAAPAPAPRAEARAASDVDALPSRRAARDPKAYAIVIGIEKYRQKLPAAEFAAADARAMSAYLTKVMGYPEENVVTLVDDQAAKSDFEKYFDKWLPNNVEPGSTVMVYYSGHGAPNPRTADAYLVPYDGDPTFLEETGYPLKRMYAALAKLPAKKVLVAIDSCFSGAGGRSVIAKGSRPLVVDIRRDMALPKNMSVLAASADDETSSTYDEKGHGLFTYFVLKGIRDENALRSDGSLDVRGLYGYVKEQVRRVARKRYNNEQTPQLLAPKE